MRNVKSSNIKNEGAVAKHIDLERLVIPYEARSHMVHKPFEIIRKGDNK